MREFQKLSKNGFLAITQMRSFLQKKLKVKVVHLEKIQLFSIDMNAHKCLEFKLTTKNRFFMFKEKFDYGTIISGTLTPIDPKFFW